MPLMDAFRKNAPTSEDWGIASALKNLKGELALVKAKQLADPDNLTDPDDRAVMAALNEAEQAIDRAIVAQSRDGREDVSKSVSQASRDDAVKNNDAFPDGSFPIRNQSEADKAWNLRGHNENHSESSIVAHIRAQVKKHGLTMPGTVTKADAEWMTEVEFLAKDDSKRIVYGVVLTPEVRDSQGDILSKEEIERTAHKFLTDYRAMDVQHSDITKMDDGRPVAEPVESFIAPADMTFHGPPVREGAWVLGARVNDDVAWGEVQKGERTGFSVAGTGTRLPD